ncbi:MAG: ABC transporter permease [Limnochordaceae bacterium]|nr:ABC transporter permease [Limnochordaceae bacterium]
MLGRRSSTPAVVAFVIAAAIVALFGRSTPAGVDAVFGLNPGGFTQAVELPDLVIPAAPAIYVLAVVAAALAGGYLAWPRLRGGVVVGLSVSAFVVAFLVWAVQGQSLNLLGMLESTLLRATPIALGALSGVLCERAAVINIAIEGMMLSAAMVAVVVGSVTGNLYLALAAAIVVGGLLGLVHGVLAIKYRVDQIVSGTVINIFAVGATSYASARFLEKYMWLNNSGTLPVWAVPGLVKIPIVGPVLFENSLIPYLMLALVIGVHVLLFRTRFGLRMRAVGEHPRAADTLGINVWRTRYLSVLLGGMVAGIGGAYFTIGSVGRFDEVMTAGRGFIGLAAMIFGNWTPFGAFASSLVFGFADSLQTKLQILQVPIPSEFLLMAPYIATMIAISGVVGRVVPPAADGQPYEK